MQLLNDVVIEVNDENLLNIIKNLEDSVFKNIIFRKVARSDAFCLFEASKNSDFNKYISWAKPETNKEVVIVIDKFIRQNELKNILISSFCEKSTGKFYGLTILKKFKDGIEFGIMLHPEYWSSGKTLYVILGLVKNIIKEKACNIYIRVMPANKKVKQILERLFFIYVEDGTEKLQSGKEIILNIYKLDKERFLQNWAKTMIIEYY